MTLVNIIHQYIIIFITNNRGIVVTVVNSTIRQCNFVANIIIIKYYIVIFVTNIIIIMTAVHTTIKYYSVIFTIN